MEEQEEQSGALAESFLEEEEQGEGRGSSQCQGKPGNSMKGQEV